MKVKNRMALWVRMILSALVVYCCDYMADWELQFPAAAQRQERVSYCILPGWKRIKVQNSK